MKRVAILLLSLLLTLGQAFCQVGHFFPSEQFSSGLINDVCQDQYGYMWIATENGLNKFDGYRFTTYLHQPGDSTTLGTNIVVKLYCDRKGQLWVGTRTGLSRYDYATDHFVHYQFTNHETPRVISIMERHDGELLVGTSGRGLFRLMSDSLQKVPGGYSSSGGNWYYNQMMEDSRHRFWKCGYGEEVTMMDASGVHSMFVSKGIVIGLAEVNDEILVLCMHGIHSYRPSSSSPGPSQFLGPLPEADIDLSALGGEKVVMSTAYRDREGNIYVGTRGEGLFRLSKGSRKLVRVESSIRGMDLNTAKIWAITEDRLGNIWIGCEQRGLVMLPRIQPQFSSWSLQRFLDLRSQLRKNTIIGRRVVLGALLLIHQGDVNQRHQRDCMFTLTALIRLSIGVITVGDELGCPTIQFLVIAVHRHFDFLVVDVQPYMEFLIVHFCHKASLYCSSLRMAMHLFTSRMSLFTRAFAPSRSPSVISSIFAIFSDA